MATFCGVYYLVELRPTYLPQLALRAHTTILANLSRTTLKQTFTNPNNTVLKDVKYVFPMYDGVSVVAFTCKIGGRTIKGVVQERQKAKETFKAAVARGETAGLLERLTESADVFTTQLGNVPANATVEVEITYLGELKADMGIDGLRFTIPTAIAPRYGNTPAGLHGSALNTKGIEIVVDAELPEGQTIRSIQSPSHQLSVAIGHASTDDTAKVEPSFRRASATLALQSTVLEKDFILQLVATNTGNPVAVLESHPTMPGHQAVMASLVPKFSLPADRPEIVFICDRSGSMHGRIPNLITGIKLFLKSLPLGVKFNICCFGSRYSFLWDRSQSYSEDTLKQAIALADSFGADYGGTEMYRPVEETFKRRYADMNLEVFLLTDGEIWDQDKLFSLVNKHVGESKGAIRMFTLGIGDDVSHSLIEGIARAGNGFSQTVAEDEKMEGKVVRMLKGALTPHIKDYTLELKYDSKGVDDDFEMVDRGPDAPAASPPAYTPTDTPTPTTSSKTEGKPSIVKKVISLFDPSANPDEEIIQPSDSKNKFASLPEVPLPKLLQTPHIIPPLFPFSRTNVYLLIPPTAATTRVPSSVLLRGTSNHGPLELEIPLTRSEGETVHQLAARKAMQELEEGRGWLFAAKDATGKLLKEKHEGRFVDMVEREAVRLGETFQVAGKWCSFVAVEDGEKKAELEMGEQAVEEEKAACEISDSFQSAVPRRSRKMAKQGNFMMAASSGLMSIGAAPAPALASAPAPKPATGSLSTPGGGFFGRFGRGGGGVGSSSLKKKDSSPADADARKGLSYQSSIAAPLFPPPPPAAPVVESAARYDGAMERNRRHSPTEYAVAREQISMDSVEDDADEDLALSAPSSMRALSRDEGLPSAAPLRGDSLDQLVALQAFGGNWTWSAKLATVLSITQERVDSAVNNAAASKSWAAKLKKSTGISDIIATALVIRFLEEKLAGERDAWDMVAGKARQWLESQLGDLDGVEVEELEGVFAGIF